MDLSDHPTASAEGTRRRWGPAPTTVAPGSVLGPGEADPTAVLVLGIGRHLFVPLVLLGLIGGVVVTGRAEVAYDDAWQVARGLGSPLAGLALAVVVRVGVALGGLVAAYPLSHGSSIAVDPHPAGRRGAIGRVTDRIHVTRALRELRSTRAVQEEAAARLGGRGRTLARVDALVRRSVLPLLGLLVVVAVVRSL